MVTTVGAIFYESLLCPRLSHLLTLIALIHTHTHHTLLVKLAPFP